MALILNLEEFAELCGVTAETMRVHVRAVEGAPVWLVERGDRGRGYKIEAEGGLAWWKKKRADDDSASAERQEQLKQLRFEHLGDAAEGEEQMSLSGKQRQEEYAAVLQRIKLRQVMGDLVERKALEPLLANAAVEHRRQLMLVPGEFAAAAGLTPAEVAPLEELIGKAIDNFWKTQFLPPKMEGSSSGDA